MQEDMSTRRSLLDAWRQVTEVLLCTSLPGDVLGAQPKQQLLLDLLQTLLNKVLADGTMPELANQVSGVVLLLVAALRQTYRHTNAAAVDAAKPSAGASDTFVPLLDSTSAAGSSARQHSVVYPSSLHVVLKGLIMWVSATSASAQRVRANLYGGLLNYLRIGAHGDAAKAETYKSSSLELTEAAKFRKANLELILSFGDNFLDILCRDTVSGHDIRRMLALSVLDELVRLDGRGSWTYYMSNQVGVGLLDAL